MSTSTIISNLVDSLVNNVTKDAQGIAQTAKQYGLTVNDLAAASGIPREEINQFFLDGGLPLGTILTGDVKRTFGTEGNIRQIDKGEDVTVEQVIGKQGNKLVVQAYDAYGQPTTTRLTSPNTSEGAGWLQALGIVGGAIGLSSLPEVSSLFSGGAGAGSGVVAGGETIAGTTAATGATTTTQTGLLSGNSALAVAGVEGAASQAATSAYASTLAATGNAALASIAADVASGNVAAGLSVTDAIAAGVTTATDAAATGAVTNTGNVVGGGGSITAGIPTSLLTPSVVTPPTTTPPTTTPPTTTPPTTTPPTTTPPPFNPTSLIPTVANTLLQGLTNINAQNVLGGLISSGANLAMVQDAADKLRQQGQLTQTEYTNLANQLGGQYDAAGAAARLGQTQIAQGILPYTETLGSTAQQGLMNVGQTAANMVGQFTPYGVTGSLFGTTYDPKTGQVNTALTEDARQMYNPFAQVAQQSANAALMTDVDQLSQDYYNKLAALSAPEEERQRLATEARLRAQGRLGVSGSAFGGSSPELLAQEQAIARQRLERELQSRQAALGERGTLVGQGTAALAPIQQLTQQEMAQAQLSGQLGQLAQQGRISAAGLFAQPAAQGYMTQAQTGLAGQQLAANAQQAGVQQQLLSQLSGLDTQAKLRSLGLAGNLQAQQEALSGLLDSRRNVVNQVLGNQGALGNVAGSLLGGLFNPSDRLPGTNMTYAQALAGGFAPL